MEHEIIYIYLSQAIIKVVELYGKVDEVVTNVYVILYFQFW